MNSLTSQSTPNIFSPLSYLEEPQELSYLYGTIAQSLLLDYKEDNINPESVLMKGINDYPKGNFSAACITLLGSYYFTQGHFSEAEATFAILPQKYPDSSYAGEALYWSAICAEKLKKDPLIAKMYRKQLFEKFPSSPFAPAAYFHYYTYRDYLQGDRAALKHLQAFQQLFPDNSLQINAHYLIGLDYKRERKGPSGRALRKKNLVEAINAFSKAELAFDTLHQQQKIPPNEIGHYLIIRYRSLLERALANQTIALESQATKRTIYAQYAQELFEQINKELADPNHPFAHYLTDEHPFPKIQEESLYLLLKNYIKLENAEAAKQAIDSLLEKYASFNMTKGYYLSCTYYEQGLLAMQEMNYKKAWIAFAKAEGSYDNLSVDQKLDLWIQQSECCKAQHELDNAMLILSKVINDNEISSLRVKAMYLRAEIYALQGRHELARKQLAATSNKGGEWALKAKTKLDEDYGYN